MKRTPNASTSSSCVKRDVRVGANKRTGNIKIMAVPIADFSAFVITIVLLSCSLKKEIKMS